MKQPKRNTLALTTFAACALSLCSVSYAAPSQSGSVARSGSAFSELMKRLGTDQSVSTAWLKLSSSESTASIAPSKDGSDQASVEAKNAKKAQIQTLQASKNTGATVFDDLTKLASTTVHSTGLSGKALISAQGLKQGMYAKHASFGPGTLIRVTDTATKKSLVLEVTGAFSSKEELVVQLSPEAAKLLSLKPNHNVTIERVLLP